MTISGLYVYSPTTFQSDTKIEPMSGAPHAPGEVQLSPGVYRFPAGAKVVATNDPTASNHTIVALDGTKGGLPDPPKVAAKYSMGQITDFLSGAGKTNELD